MDLSNFFPTKGNLIIAKNTLALSKQGYELLDKKRNILIREMMDLIDKAKKIQNEIDKTFDIAYKALQSVNILMGIEEVSNISHAVPIENSVQIRFRSVMGTDVPMVRYDKADDTPPYGFFRTVSSMDRAFTKFKKAKELSIELAEIENAVCRLAVNIKKTQKRAKALQNAIIPAYEELTKHIQEVLEEKERDEFTRLKVIKKKLK